PDGIAKARWKKILLLCWEALDEELLQLRVLLVLLESVLLAVPLFIEPIETPFPAQEPLALPFERSQDAIEGPSIAFQDPVLKMVDHQQQDRKDPNRQSKVDEIFQVLLLCDGRQDLLQRGHVREQCEKCQREEQGWQEKTDDENSVSELGERREHDG